MSDNGAASLLFLDVDGVLNSDWCSGQVPFDPHLISLLNSIVVPTDAEVILSSTWRKLYRLSEVERMLIDAGYQGRLDGMTPHTDDTRGANIAMFLRYYPGRHIRGYGGVAILDDDADMAPLMHRLVKTDARFGLQNPHTEQAIKLLCDPFDPELELPNE